MDYHQKSNAMMRYTLLSLICASYFFFSPVYAAKSSDTDPAAGSEPFAMVNKLDLISELEKDGGISTYDFHLKGAQLFGNHLKFNYELHYNVTNATGMTENDFEKMNLKPIYIFDPVALNDNWSMSVGLGGEWIIDFNHQEQGIGNGADQISPMFGVSFDSDRYGLTILPIIQHFVSYNNNEVNTTRFRLIVTKNLTTKYWVKLDTKIPYDWNDDTVPASQEFQLGKMFNHTVGVFVEALVGIGGARTFDWGTSLGLRFRY